MNPGRWLSERIIQADRLAAEGKAGDAFELLFQSIRPMARRHGTADALALAAKVYFQLNQAHHGEVACLGTLRLFPSLIAREVLFHTLVNLTSFNLTLKSYEEAYAYGVMAERVQADDSDHTANMVMAAAFTERAEEALARFDRLERLAPMKAAVVKRYLEADGPAVEDVRSTRALDCSGILRTLKAAAAAGRGDQLFAPIRELQQRPEGIGARDCWLELCHYYNQTLDIADGDEYLLNQGFAGLAAASGKAINASPAEAERDGALWLWRGTALKELRLFELAVPALAKAAALAPTPALAEALRHCSAMADLRRTAAGAPDDLLPIARRRAREPDGFWDAFDLFQERLFHSEPPLDERILRSKELHDRGFALFNTDKTEAIACLCEAAANHPEVSHTWQELGSLHSSLNRFREAERFQRYAVELVRATSPLPPDAARFWANLANCRCNRALSDPALSAAHRDLKLRQAADDARQAIELGDLRAQAVLQRIAAARSGSAPKGTAGQGCATVLSAALAFLAVCTLVLCWRFGYWPWS